MQPYIFPYIGYFQLINLVDKFIVYDDVNFIKQGWINRNRILLNGKDFLFTIPLKGSSSFKFIKDIELDCQKFNLWKNKFYKTLEQGYKNAPYYSDTINFITQVLERDYTNVSQLSTKSLLHVANFLNIDTEFSNTSTVYENAGLSGQTRVIDICLKEHATEYFNAYGGQQLYSFDAFSKNDIKLTFIQPVKTFYKQFNNEFVPFLSIIDVMMFNSVNEIKAMLNNYVLI